MLQGEPVPGCEQCYVKEQTSGQSYRTRYNDLGQRNLNLQKTIAACSQHDYAIEPRVSYLDLRLGNLCNLNCRSCGPRNSSQLNREVMQMSINSPDIKTFYQTESLDLNSWYQSPQFQQNIEKIAPDLRLLYITGGEPTIIAANLTLLESLVEQGVSSNITVKLSTNLTNLSPRLLTVLQRFAKTLWFVSIDGLADTQEYLRYPSRWSAVKKNLQLLTETTDPEQCQIVVTPTIQNVNFLSITDLFEFLRPYTTVQIWPIVLESPRHFDLQYLPMDFKQQCWQRWNSWYETCHQPPDLLQAAHQQIWAKCQTPTPWETVLREFWHVTQMFDRSRGSDLKTVNHRLWQICQSL